MSEPLQPVPPARTPEQEQEYQTFMDTCMQEKLDAMPDMSARRIACQAEWDAAHPVAPRAATPPATPPKP